MAGHLERGARTFGNRWRIAGWGTMAALLLLPLIAMRFTDEVNWDATDFAFATILMGGVGIGLELAVRMSRHFAYRAGAAAALAAAFLMTWANGAVGIIGSERDPINTIFTGIVALALITAAIARFRPRGMAVAMLTTACAQIVAGVIGFTLDPKGAMLSGIFVVLWLASAALFHKAAREQT
ncbi:MAG TPA: hypothetical protein VEA16_03395 [Vicinamibacterales bacterium]|nr:hypothetical protein [Vicinamibacterales bacterium]